MSESPKEWYLRKYKETGDENYLKMHNQLQDEPKDITHFLKESTND